jgi:glycine hydroxymethyltransferase
MKDYIKKTDPDVAKLIKNEEKRQQDVLEMIPSENYASRSVREAVGSVFINKYSEGQVKKRYYQGNANVDELEALCKKRALEAFHLAETEWGVNVQALSGSPANLAVISALVEPGETIMSMYLPDGGHLSHGWYTPEKKSTFTSKFWDISFYKVDQNTRLFNYDALEQQAKNVKPKLLISGGTAYPREIDHARMGKIARSVGAYYLADVAHEAGLIAAGVNTSPFPYAHVVTMTTHKTLRGPRGALIFARKDSPMNLRLAGDKVTLASLVDLSVFPGLQGGPHNHTIAGITVALGEVLKPEFKVYATQVIKNAQKLAAIFAKNGFDVVSGSTDKHLVLLDLRSKHISAWVAAWALEYAGIVMNRNTVPYDTGSSYYPSGLRMGTPAITTRGMKEPEMQQIGAWVCNILEAVSVYHMPEDKNERSAFIKTIREDLRSLPVIQQTAIEVKALTKNFPVV